ncbi:MAG: YolD-like family protein [Butyrivibrio sp.]|nr:YolD-like family protein [Butyrivibrio sp.]
MENIFNNTDRYLDIINLPHHVSNVHPQMDMISRAAQFSPFAALTGYDDAVKESARLTEEKIELDEESKDALDSKISIIYNKIDSHPEVTVTFFVKDSLKSGGKYISKTGVVKKIDPIYKKLIFTDLEIVNVNDIIDITGEIFSSYND